MANLYVSNPRHRARRARRSNPATVTVHGAKVSMEDYARAMEGTAMVRRKRSDGVLSEERFQLKSDKKSRKGSKRKGSSKRGRAAVRRAKSRIVSRGYASSVSRIKKSTRRRLLRRYRPSRAMRRDGHVAKRRLGYVKGHIVKNFMGKGKSRRVRGHLRNPLMVSNPLVISNPMGGIPVIGTAISMIGPALFGGLGVEAIGQVTKFVAGNEMIQEYTPEIVKEYMPRVQYTVGGLLLAGVVQMITPIPAPLRHSLGLALASAGGAVDWYRYRSESGAYGDLNMGDGGNWSVESDEGEYGDVEFGDLALGDLNLGDAGDEDYCGDDFSVAEGEAAAKGAGHYVRRFPHKPGMRTRGVEGHRFRWMLRHAGADNFQHIANMPPAERIAMIRRMKADFKRNVGGERRQIEQQPGPMPVTAPVDSGSAAPTADFSTAGAAF